MKNSKLFTVFSILTIVFFMALNKGHAQYNGFYVGGPMYLGGQPTYDRMKASGFNEAILWAIHVDPVNGDIYLNMPEPLLRVNLISNGAWVSTPENDAFLGLLSNLKGSDSSIERITWSIGTSFDNDFLSIETLINAEGTGPTSKLYKNFQALKQVMPFVDALDYDDEQNFDEPSMTQFSIMAADLGYKVSFSPYNRQSFWKLVYDNVEAQRPGTIDCIHLQRYAGGAGNDPGQWNTLFSGLEVSPGLASNDYNASQMANIFSNWESQYGIAGGFIWLWDYFENNNSPNAPSNYSAAIQPVVNQNTAIKNVCYVEVNSTNMANVAAYSYEGTTDPVVDIAIIFAANIDRDPITGRALAVANPNVSKVLNDPASYIKPLQDRGTKVLLDILGNHSGLGICNFQTREEAKDFALQLKHIVDEYGLDGIDLDDEWAKYGENGTNPANAYSFIMLLQELRLLMPDKLITFYDYGEAKLRKSWNGFRAGDYLDYAWQPFYGVYAVPDVPPLGKENLAPAAVWFGNTSTSTVSNFATRTVNDGYGAYLWYDPQNVDRSSYFSFGTQIMQGKNTVTTSPLQGWTQQTQCAFKKPDGHTATYVNSSSVEFSWSGIPNQTYTVDYKLANSNTWTNVATGSSATSVIVNNLVGGESYDWRVKLDCTNVIYTYGKRYLHELAQGPSFLTATAQSETSIELSWTDNETSEDGFKIERKTILGNFAEVATVGANITTYLDENLTEDTGYIYRVRSYTGSDNSNYSNEASAKTLGGSGIYGIALNGVSQYGSAGPINLSGSALTMEAWVNPTAFKSASPFISSIMGIESGSNTALVRLGDAGIAANKVQVVLNINGNTVKLNSNTDLVALFWYHIAATYDGTNIRLYINGQLDASVRATGSITANADFEIGRNFDSNRILDGKLDEMRVWNRVLSAQEILDNSCAVAPAAQGLVAHWKLDEGISNVGMDQSGNGHNITFSGIDAASWITDVYCSAATSNPPVANFVASATAVNEGDSVGFTDQSTNLPTSWLWSFSGGTPSSSTAQNPSVTYATAGTYSVTLTATNADGSGSITKDGYITVTAIGNDYLNFNDLNMVSYSNQDNDGTYSVLDAGATIFLQNDTWKRTQETYNITPNTVIEFEFMSTSRGKLHGIGFDNDHSFSRNNIFRVFGNSKIGISDFNNYSTLGVYKAYQIPVGSYYTGNNMHLVMANDIGRGSGNTSYFRNVRIYENGASKHIGQTFKALNTVNGVTGIKLFPNPFYNTFSLKLSNGHEYKKVQIFGMSGRLIFEDDIEEKLNVAISLGANYRSGIYILKLIGAANERHFKLVKH